MKIKQTDEVRADLKRINKVVRRQSKQPRLEDNADYSTRFFGSVFRFIKSIEDVPAYQPDSRNRDTFLANAWRMEPHLAGVVNSVTLIDSNRGWSLTGGRNQVMRYERTFRQAENGRGWRYYANQQSLAYWTTDIGAVTETERMGIPGPLTNIYTVDSTKCTLKGGKRNSLAYYPKNGKPQLWNEVEYVEQGGGEIKTPADYWRVSSMPSFEEEFNGLGFCAVSRCIELAQIMVAVWQYDQEKLGARAPKGLLILHNVSEQQWDDALRARDAEVDGLEREWFGSVATLVSAGVDQIDAKLIALSSLPENFDKQTFTDLTMFAYALCFGYDPTEFWPVNAGIMGRGRETEIQHRKATGKGGLAFSLSQQDQIQLQLPPTLHYESEQRDIEGEILEAERDKLYADMAVDLYTAIPPVGEELEPLLSREEARSFLAAHTSLIPERWTDLEEPTVASDTNTNVTERKRLREVAREVPAVILAGERFGTDPIIRFEFPSGVPSEPQRTRIVTLWDRGDEMFRPINWRGVDTKKRLYTGENGFRITSEDVALALE